jgi:tetratricopeptide (TPR) repeat protein
LSLGDLLRGQKDYSGAAAAYEMVNEVSRPDPELLQKANLSAGEMYDVMNHRDLAMKKYEAVIAANSSTAPAESARRYLKEAYRDE